MVRITAAPGSTFLDRMIALVEGAERQKTPERDRPHILLAGLTIIFLSSRWRSCPLRALCGRLRSSITVLVALLVVPDPDHHRRPAVGHRHRRHGPAVRFNVLAMSGRAVEAAGDVDTLLLDKTGTITLGNRQATEFIPCAASATANSPTPAQLA